MAEMEQKTMKAAFLDEIGKSLVIKDVPIPVPGNDEVLVKMSASPINPSDLALIDGMYGSAIPLPVVPGFEGSGTIIAAGKGKRVAVLNTGGKFGCWGEFCIVNAKYAIPIPNECSDDIAACGLINPLTVLAMCSLAKAKGSKAIINSAGASQLGKQLIRFGKSKDLKVIAIVRHDKQIKELKDLGAAAVLNMEGKDFEKELQEACDKFSPQLFFDAIGGSKLIKQMSKAMPKNSTTYIYGLLHDEHIDLNPADILFKCHNVLGFRLDEWLKTQRIEQLFTLTQKLKGSLSKELKTDIVGRHPLKDIIKAISEYRTNLGKGKILIKFDDKTKGKESAKPAEPEPPVAE